MLERPSEKEAYLAAILLDESGLDQAEFLWKSSEDDGPCWRAWPFQYMWWRDKSRYQIEQGARSIGKSMGVKARATAFPFVHRGKQMVITAPEGNHLDVLTNQIELAYQDSRVLKSMLSKGRSGVTHRPFTANFKNSSTILGRIPGPTGKGVKGIHPAVLEQDEASDYPHNGWTELIETLQEGYEKGSWRAHGVTRGVRDKFWEFTQPNSGWKIHHLTALHRPTWSDEERERKIRQYGGSSSDPEYLRNVMGRHGNSVNPIFILARLTECFDFEKESTYNSDVFQHVKISHENIQQYEGVEHFLDLPYSHKKMKNIWIGMDVGFTEDPSEILCYEETISKTGVSSFRLVSRFSLERLTIEDQASCILYLMDFYDTKGFGIDKTGNGIGLFQRVQAIIGDSAEYKRAGFAEKFKGYGFSEKILSGYEETDLEMMMGDPNDGKFMEGIDFDNPVLRNVLEYSTDVLRFLVDTKAIMMPADNEIFNHFQAQTYMVRKSKVDEYGRSRKFSSGSFHTLDAARMAALAWHQEKVEEIEEAHRSSSKSTFVATHMRVTNSIS